MLGTATIAQAAHVATGTIVGSGLSEISTYGCSAGTWANTSVDTAATSGRAGCSSVTVKIYYVSSTGYSGWTNAKVDADYAQLSLSSGRQLVKSYHTAIARSTTAQ